MKKLNIIIIFTLLIAILPHEVFSDSWYVARSSCKWWRKKYKTDAKIRKVGNSWWHDYDKGCTWAESFKSASDYNCQGNYFIAAEAFAKAGDNMSNTSWSYVGYCQNWNAGHDVDYFSPKYSIVPLLEYSDFDNDAKYNNMKFGTKVTIEDITWDINNNSVRLSGIKIELSVSPKNIANNYTVAMIRIESAENEDGSNQNTIYWESKAFVYNGELIFEGEFEKSNPLSITKIEHGDYRLSANSVVINLNKEEFKGISMDDIQVASYSDAGNLAIGIPEIYAIDFENNKKVAEINDNLTLQSEFNFTIFPNPVGSLLKVETLIKDNTRFDVNIINMNGKIIKELKGTEIVEGTSTISFDITTIPAGVYFLQFRSEKQSYMKKFIKK